MSQFLKAVNEQAGNISNLDLLDQLASVLDKHREVGIQEAIYRILSLPMAKSSVKVKFLSTRHPHFRDGLLKADLEDLSEGESIFHMSPHEYYSMRELSCIDGVHYEDDEKQEGYWKRLALSEFWSDYDIVYHKQNSKGKVIGKPDKVQSEAEHNLNDPNPSPESSQQYTPMSSDSKNIPLKNGVGYIKRRKQRCILRYYLNFDNDEDLKRGLLILFFPFENEMEDIHQKDIDQLYRQNEEIITEKRGLFEKHKVMTDIIESIERKQGKEENEDDEEELEDESFQDVESTTTEELENFETWAKQQAKKSLMKYKESTSILQIESLRNLIMKLNTQQRIIFDDFCERMNGDEETPTYLYIAGEAGTGKSFLVKVMIEAIKHLKLTPGLDLRKPPVLVMAPTANAAYIINGKTIESSLGMLPNKCNSFSKRKSNQTSNLSFMYEDVVALICDEISMVGSSKFTKMNFQIQDITGSKEFMGGIPFVAVGDFRQLPPVRDQFIFEKNHLDGRPSIAPSHWDDHFRIYYLTDKMRNQKDPDFASLCDRVGNGTYTQNDLQYLKSCIRDTDSENYNENFKNGKISIIVLTNKVRQEINEHKLNTLLQGQKTYMSRALDRCTNLENPPDVPENLPLTQTGGLESQLLLKIDAPVVVTSNHAKAKYKEDGIMNGAKGYIDSVQVSKSDAEKVEVVWIVFKDENIGKVLRYDLRHLLKLHKPFNEKAVPILREKKTFSIQNGEIRYQRFQFPLTLSYAITTFKCQGDTLDEVIIDFYHTAQDIKSVPCGSFYVALTRVKEGKNVFLKSFEENYITFNKRVEDKIRIMRKFKPYLFKKIYIFDQIFNDNTDDLKIAYLNINGFMRSNHAQYLDFDHNLLSVDYLALSETWLNKEFSNKDVQRKLNNWKLVSRIDASDNEQHMGLLLLVPATKMNVMERLYNIDNFEGYKTNTKNLLYQGLVVNIKNLYRRIVFMYIRETPNVQEVKKISQFVQKCDCLIGDLNLNPKLPDQRRKLMTLCGKTKYLALEELTTTIGNQLEHIILEQDLKQRSYSTAYHSFASDHKSIALRLASSANGFTETFKEIINFNKDFHTKKKGKHSNQKTAENIGTDMNEEKTNENLGACQKDSQFFTTNKDKESADETNVEAPTTMKILLFTNPSKNNLCFANSTASLLLNIHSFQSLLRSETNEMNLFSRNNEIVRELIHLVTLPNFSKISTKKLRSVVHSNCVSSGQITRTFDDNKQHDAGEFLLSIFEHMFKDLTFSYNIDEILFGGLYQESVLCICGHVRELPVQPLSEIMMVPIIGFSLQECISNFFTEEEVQMQCSECQNKNITKRISIIREPSTLIIQLKRYRYVKNQRKYIKRKDFVDFEKNIKLASGGSYILSSVLNHYGDGPEQGHYDLVVHDVQNDSFVLMDDLNIKFNVTVNAEQKTNSYIFVYTKES